MYANVKYENINFRKRYLKNYFLYKNISALMISNYFKNCILERYLRRTAERILTEVFKQV